MRNAGPRGVFSRELLREGGQGKSQVGEDLNRQRAMPCGGRADINNRAKVMSGSAWREEARQPGSVGFAENQAHGNMERERRGSKRVPREKRRWSLERNMEANPCPLRSQPLRLLAWFTHPTFAVCVFCVSLSQPLKSDMSTLQRPARPVLLVSEKHNHLFAF